MADSLESIFAALRDTMLRSSSGTDVSRDEPGDLVLKTPWNEPGKKEPAWFGAVQLKKNYVSYHLMPLYSLPGLKDGISSTLAKRMQGKSCFNFKKAEPELFEELARLTAACAAAYAAPMELRPHA